MSITLIEESRNFIGLSQYLLLILDDFIKNNIKSLIRKSFKGNKSLILFGLLINLANIYFLQLNYRNTRKRRGICSKLTIKTPEQRHRY